MAQIEWLRDNEPFDPEKKIIIFGAGQYGKKAAFIAEKEGYRVLEVFDNNASGIVQWGRTKIVKPYDAVSDDVVVIIAIYDAYVVQKIRSQLNTLHYYDIRVVDTDSLDAIINSLPDDDYLKVRFLVRMDRELDLDNPKTFNEKLNWLKIYNRKAIYTTMVDKCAVKKYVSEIIGKEYIVPTVGVWDSVDDIDPAMLPEKFVLKCTHDSGSIVICRDKSSFNWDETKSKFENALKKNYYWQDREWPYKDVKGRIICEELIESKEPVLDVYKVFNFMGEPMIIQVIQNDKTSEETIDYFDTDWNLLDLRQNFPNSKYHKKKPDKLRELLSLSRELSRDIPFVRTDFYIVDGKVLFSEFTFFSDSGAERFHPEEWDRKLGDLIMLDSST